MKQKGQITTKRLPDIIMRRRIEWGLHGYWEFSQPFKVSHKTMHTQWKKVSIGFFLLKNIFF